MTALDALWHLANFLAPAWAVSALLAALQKLIWRRELKALAWRRLALWGGLGGTLALIAALLLLGQDGKMAGYALLLLGVTLPQWALGWKR